MGRPIHWHDFVQFDERGTFAERKEREEREQAGAGMRFRWHDFAQFDEEGTFAKHRRSRPGEVQGVPSHGPPGMHWHDFAQHTWEREKHRREMPKHGTEPPIVGVPSRAGVFSGSTVGISRGRPPSSGP